MSNLPLSIGNIHFIGIGGIGMSGIAEVLNELGYQVTGSDLSENSNTKRLNGLGIKILIGHKKSNIQNSNIVEISTAINNNNIELIEAKKKGFDVILAFIIQREDCQKFKIADDIDPEYKKLLTFALKKSLKIICYECKFLAKGIKINKKIKFIN